MRGVFFCPKCGADEPKECVLKEQAKEKEHGNKEQSGEV